MEMAMIDMLNEYYRMGFSVIACKAASKTPLASWKQYQNNRASMEQLNTWAHDNPDCNWAIITGKVSGIVVIDTDNPDADAYAQHRGLPPTLTAKTAKGYHYYYAHTPLRNTTSLHGIDGLDIRGDGGYVICPPSIHPSGAIYEWITPLDTPLAPLPTWVTEQTSNTHTNGNGTHTNGNGNGRETAYIRAAIDGKLNDACLRVAEATDGTKHNTLRNNAVILGGYVHYGVADAETITAALLNSLPSTVTDWEKAHATVRDGIEYGMKNPLHDIVVPSPSAKPSPKPSPKPSAPDDERMLHTKNNGYHLPPGYFFRKGAIWRNDTLIYMGKLWIEETGINIHSQEQTALVRWKGGGTWGEVVALRSELATQAGIAKTIGGNGGAIHASNARHVSKYLVELLHVNRREIPHVKHSEYYGNVDDGMLLPAGKIGGDQNLRYIGTPISIGKDANIYPQTLAAIRDWATPVLWATLALGIASPLYAKMRNDRNPILHLGGASGSGKTTITHFAVGAYGDPRVRPLQIQCGSGTTTPKGMATSLIEANGLPVFFDDIHKMIERQKAQTEGIIYDFANGQNRSYGTPGNRKTAGGQEIRGLLITAGETSLSFMNAGSNNRVFSWDCNSVLPLGCPARSSEGVRRARILNAAWEHGAGLFGHQVLQRILGDFDQFKLLVQAYELDKTLEPLQAWRRLLAIAATTLQYIDSVANLDLDTDALLRNWATQLQLNNAQRDPAEDAWERVRLLFIQSEYSNDAPSPSVRPSWHYLSYNRMIVAARRDGQEYWRCMHVSQQWKETIGENAIEMFGNVWADAGMILRHNNGTISKPTWMGKGSPRCLLIPTTITSPHSDMTDEDFQWDENPAT
jgi:hypothetical protein